MRVKIQHGNGVSVEWNDFGEPCNLSGTTFGYITLSAEDLKAVKECLDFLEEKKATP